MRRELLVALNAERQARRAAILITDLISGEQRLVRGSEVAQDPLADLLEERLHLCRSGPVEAGSSKLFLLVQVPRRRLVVLGAVHISQALAPLAKLTDLDIVIVDPRTAFATPERFPDVAVITEWPQEALPKLGLDAFTAVAALTHNPELDDPALAAALSAGCFYVGALGSQKSHAKRLERLRAQGFAETQLKTIHGPIGLDIGAIGPGEIAVSIIGEIIAAMRRKPLRAAIAA